MIFNDKDRSIYPFMRNGKQVYGDPVALLRKLTACLGGEDGMDQTITQAQDGPPEVAFKAMDAIRNATCVAFGLGEPFNEETGKGVTEEEWLDVYAGFMEWLKKNATTDENWPTSSPPSPVPAFPDQSTTPTTAGSS
jgi:hypothetical protein